MFWRSVVFKLWGTIILLVAFVLMILTLLLLEFFEDFFVEDTEESLLDQAENIALVLDEHDSSQIMETIDKLMHPSTSIAVFINKHLYWQTAPENDAVEPIDPAWFITNDQINEVFDTKEPVKKTTKLQ